MTKPARQFWWSAAPESSAVHESLFSTVRAIEEDQYEIARGNFFNACLYTNRETPGTDWGTHTERDVSYGPISTTTENIVSQVVETISALLGKNRPKPTPVVKDASFSIERMAADLDRFMFAEFKRHKVYDRGSEAFDDSCWAAIAGLKLDFEYDADGNAVDYYVERVLPDEIVVDQREARYGMPLHLYQRKVVSREQLKAQYPDYAYEIETADTSSIYTSYRTPGDDYIVVLEAWRRPSAGEEGRHVISISNAVFVDEEYKRECFPFVFLKWFPLPASFYARPLVEELAPGQIRYNELDYKIRLCQDLIAVPRIMADNSSKFSVEQLDNSIAKILRYKGSKPETVQWQAASPEIYSERERERAGMFERAGISRLSAQAKLPDNARLDSSKALRELNLIENQRFAKQAQRVESFYLEVAKQMLWLNAQLHKGGVKRKAKFHLRSVIHEIDWEQVAELVDMDGFELQIEASSLMNTTPAAREDIVNTWIFNGWIPPERGMELLGHPDLEQEVALLGARVKDIKRTLENLDNVDADFPTPIPYQDIGLGIRMAQLTYLRRRGQVDVPPEVLERYDLWIAQAMGLQQAATAASNASQQVANQAAQAQLQAPTDPAGFDALQQNLQPTNVGTEGNVTAGVATTAQGTPTSALI